MAEPRPAISANEISENIGDVLAAIRRLIADEPAQEDRPSAQTLPFPQRPAPEEAAPQANESHSESPFGSAPRRASDFNAAEVTPFAVENTAEMPAFLTSSLRRNMAAADAALGQMTEDDEDEGDSFVPVPEQAEDTAPAEAALPAAVQEPAPQEAEASVTAQAQPEASDFATPNWTTVQANSFAPAWYSFATPTPQAPQGPLVLTAAEEVIEAKATEITAETPAEPEVETQTEVEVEIEAAPTMVPTGSVLRDLIREIMQDELRGELGMLIDHEVARNVRGHLMRMHRQAGDGLTARH